jgi:hypothetical protein
VEEDTAQIRRHIDILSEFERKYGEYIGALEADHAASMADRFGYEGEQEYEGSGWSAQEWTKRKREIAMLAVRADLAMKASRVGQVGNAEAEIVGKNGKGWSPDLPSQVFDFADDEMYGDGLSIPRAILARVPVQIVGLEMRLEDAESPEASNQPKRERAKPRRRAGRWGWVNHPWTITIVGTVVGGVILAAILGAFH